MQSNTVESPSRRKVAPPPSTLKKFINKHISYSKLVNYWMNLSYLDIVKVIFGVSVIMLGMGMLVELHYHTYVWQSTSLADFLRPSTRTKCLYNDIDLNDDTNLAKTQSIPKSSSKKFHAGMKRPKIGVLMVYDNREGSWEPSLMNRVVENRKAYCSLHGYDLIDASKEIVLSRPTAWSKISSTLKHIHQYDYIFYIDMDVVIMDLQRPAEVYLSNHIDKEGKPLSSPDFIMTGDWNGPNTGVWLAKNSTWMTWFLKEVWKQEQMVEKKSPEGITYPFEYEQRAFHYMLNTEVWKSRGLPVYNGPGAKDVASHFVFLPQCAFNSYSLHPFYLKGEREISQYVEGDFLVHFAGKKGKAKTNLLDYYLGEAAKSQRKIHG